MLQPTKHTRQVIMLPLFMCANMDVNLNTSWRFSSPHIHLITYNSEDFVKMGRWVLHSINPTQTICLKRHSIFLFSKRHVITSVFLPHYAFAPSDSSLFTTFFLGTMQTPLLVISAKVKQLLELPECVQGSWRGVFTLLLLQLIKIFLPNTHSARVMQMNKICIPLYTQHLNSHNICVKGPSLHQFYRGEDKTREVRWAPNE